MKTNTTISGNELVKDTLVKVIAIPDGKVHIALNTGESVYGSPSSLLYLISKPSEFYEVGYRKYDDSTEEVFRKRTTLNGLKYLTLITVDTNYALTVYFNFLLDCLGNGSSIKPVNLNSYLKDYPLPSTEEFLAKLYLHITNSEFVGMKVDKEIPYDEEKANAISSELFNAMLNCIAYPKKSAKSATTDKNSPTEEGDAPYVPYTVKVDGVEYDLNQYISMMEFAIALKEEYGTVASWFKKGWLETAFKYGRNVYVHKDQKRPLQAKNWNRRHNKVKPVKSKSNLKQKSRAIKKKRSSEKEVQDYLRERNLFTDKVIPYFRTQEEADYFVSKSYHEVCWEGLGDVSSFLIIDIKPEYFVEKYGKTNRQLIQEGKSPVVPGDEDFCLTLHHLGQKVDSPICVVSGRDHSKKSAVFHGATSHENKHTISYGELRKAFWDRYLKEYDKANGVFANIDYLNRWCDRRSPV